MKNLYELNDDILQRILEEILSKDKLSSDDIKYALTITRLLTERHKIDSNERNAEAERQTKEKLAKEANLTDIQKAQAERESRERISKDDRDSKERISKDDREADIQRVKAELDSKEKISKDEMESRERISMDTIKADVHKSGADRLSREKISKAEIEADENKYCKEFWSSVLSTVGNIGGTALNVITLIALFKAGLLFEETGVISSNMVKGLAGKIFSLVGKK